MEGYEDIELQDFNAPEERQDDVEEDIEETGFSGLPDVPFEEPSYGPQDAADHIDEIRSDLRRDSLVNDFYEEIERAYDLQPTTIEYNCFEVGEDGKTLYLKVNNKQVRITSTKSPSKFLSLNTIAGNIGSGGARAIRNFLNLPKFAKSRPPPEIEQLERTADAAAEAGDDGLDTSINDVVDALSAATQTDVGASSATTQTDGLILRELEGLDKALRSIRGEKALQESKKVALQQTLEGLRKDLERPGSAERAEQIEREIQKAEDQLAATQESIDTLNFNLRSQVRQIRETLTRVFDLKSDATLAERVRTLFREQGVTIASILTAIGFAISALVLALTGGATPAPTPAPPPKPSDKGGAKEWLKKQLQSLGRVLANLAGKAAAALPGVIGSIVSWLLSLLAKTEGWLAGNLWAVVVAVGGLLLVAACGWLV